MTRRLSKSSAVCLCIIGLGIIGLGIIGLGIIGLGIIGLILPPAGARAATPTATATETRAAVDPTIVMRRLRTDLDLQTTLPGDKVLEDKTPDSDLELKIPGATTILWIALAVVLALVLYALKDMIPGLSRRDRARVEGEADQALTVEAAERMVRSGDDADDLAGQGRFGEAMHLLLLRSLVELRRRLGVTLADSLTSREILVRLTLPGEGREALGDLIRRVELAHFGAKPSALEDYEACRASYDRLIAAVLDTSGVPLAAAA